LDSGVGNWTRNIAHPSREVEILAYLEQISYIHRTSMDVEPMVDSEGSQSDTSRGRQDRSYRSSPPISNE
jgi:hypothetical protein